MKDSYDCISLPEINAVACAVYEYFGFDVLCVKRTLPVNSQLQIIATNATLRLFPKSNSNGSELLQQIMSRDKTDKETLDAFRFSNTRYRTFTLQ